MNARFILSAFGDEISDDLSVQLETLAALQISFLELRGVWGKNVLELSDAEVRRVRETCREQGVQISTIGSPIGKSPLVVAPELELNNLARSFEIASLLGTQSIRVFSFYPPLGTPPEEYDDFIDASAERLSSLASEATTAGFTLLLENEKDIVGDTIARCHMLLTMVNSDRLRFAWDPANFVQVGESESTTAGWPFLGRLTAHVHIKDALVGGEVQPAGQGDGQVSQLLEELRDTG